MKTLPTPFKRIDYYGGDNMNPNDGCIAFEAVFDLPNDGCSNNQIVFRCVMESDSDDTCQVYVIGRTSKDIILGQFDTKVKLLGNVLYGFAQVRTRDFLDFSR
jgi:hypothetical protein